MAAEKKLSKKEFDLLVYLLDSQEGEGLTQKGIAEKIGVSVGSVNKLINGLNQNGYLDKYTVTGEGKSALEPYRVKNACFLAAGFGSRLAPITLNTPKPLVRVHGIRIIDTLLDACLAAGIENIYIVRGYLKEQFDLLLEKYPMIHFIDNPLYNETNNISSALLLGERLANTYMFEADLFLRNPKLVTKYQYCSNYLGIPVERSDDYVINVKNGRIVGSSLGGYNCHQIVGITYWTEEDGKVLQQHIKETFEMPGGKEKFFGGCVDLKETYMGIRECSFDDVIEIDTFRELQEIDPAYKIG